MSKDRSPWLELHVSAANHRKTWKLAQALGVDRVTAFGHICCLWLWALEQAQDGDLSGFSDEAIADAAGWKKKPHRFIDALQASGYVDQDLRIHEHQLYVGKLMEKRRKDRARKSPQTPSDLPPDSPRAIPAETRAGVERHSQQSTVNSQPMTTTTAGAGARERYYRAFGHEGTEDQIQILDSYLETHPAECSEWVFEQVAGAPRPGFGLARFLFSECGLGHKPHGPRVKEQPHAATKRGTTGRRPDFEVAGAGAGPDF